MNQIQLYHGSDHVIERPAYLGGKNNNDYGNGFYTTEHEDKARSWALLNGSDGMAIVNNYTLFTEQLNVLNLDDYGALGWITEVISHRGTEDELSAFTGNALTASYHVDTSWADVMIGYRADDSYMQVITAFLKNYINLDEVVNLFYKGSLGTQVFLKSKRAFENITFQNSFTVEMDEQHIQEDREMRYVVQKFLNNRYRQVVVDEYKVSGITASYAVKHRLSYDKESGSYDCI